MNKRFELYRLVGCRTVAGWLRPEVLAVLSVLDSVQRSTGIAGAMAEIGVHHGRLLVGLNLLRRDGEHSVAIDVFGDQQHNVDNSGKGDLRVFRRNMLRWSSLDSVEIFQSDSTKVEASQLRKLAHGTIRFFSVDGGHIESTVLSDMKLAESTLSMGGVVIADDVFNESWPGVATGTMQYMTQGGSLTPFGIGFNKVFFTQSEWTGTYRQALQNAFGNKIRIHLKASEFAGHPVVVLTRRPPTPRVFLRRSKKAREIYHRLKG